MPAKPIKRQPTAPSSPLMADPIATAPGHEEQVRQKAYELWVLEGKPEDGEDIRRWIAAENLISGGVPDKVT